MNQEVTICFVSFNTWALTRLCIDSIVKFTKSPYRLLIADNGSTDGSREELEKLQHIGQLDLLIFNQSPGDFGSRAHAITLDQMMKHVVTKYTLIFDSDCIALRNNWVEDLLREFDNMTKAIGAKPFRAHDDIGMIHANCLCFETQLYHDLGLTFMPDIEKNIDTGGCISLGLVKAGYTLKYVDWLNMNDIFPGRYFYGVRCAEYVLNNKPIWAHFGRGSSRGKAGCDYETELKKWLSKSEGIIYEV